MKAIQFIHPMFLTALGLHASLLFVPIGDSSEPDLLEEDVPIAELTADANRAASRPTADKLPVPDPNVNAGAAKPSSAKPSSAKATPSATTRTAPRATTVKPAAPAAQITTTGAVTASGTANSAGTSSTETSSVGDAIRSAAGGSSGSNSNGSGAQGSNDVTTPVVSSAPEQSTSFIPDLSAGENDETDSTAAESGASVPRKNAKLTELMAALPRDAEVPTSLEASVLALQEALLYRTEGTTDDDAEQMRAAWISAVSRQASSASNVARVEPTVQSDLVLNYPMASSVLRKGRSLNVCLDEKPSHAEVGLLFDAEGELAVAPQILRSTGYEALNLELIAMLKNEANFPGGSEAAASENRSAKAYIYEVEVNYDAEQCVNLSELQS